MTLLGRYIRLVEADLSAPAHLYHTTSLKGLLGILEARVIRPKDLDGFVSLSEIALPQGDIEGRAATIAFSATALVGQTVRVFYTRQWFNAHPEQAAYVAGDGWREMANQFDAGGWDEDEEEAEPDDTEAEFEAFLHKSREREHVSREAGAPVSFAPEAVLGVVLHDAPEKPVRAALDRLGYGHVRIVGGH